MRIAACAKPAMSGSDWVNEFASPNKRLKRQMVVEDSVNNVSSRKAICRGCLASFQTLNPLPPLRTFRRHPFFCLPQNHNSS